MRCPVCKTIVPYGDTACLDCGAEIKQMNGHHIPPVTLDDAKPIPGVLSQLFEKWRGKRVRIKKTKQTGRVVGVNPRPRFPLELPTVESGYLTISLDKPDYHKDVVDNALPEDVEVL